jgi:excisionase family DNA binding protein
MLDTTELASLIREAIREVLREEVERVARPERLLTAREAAEVLGTTENAIRTATSRGKIPAVRRDDVRAVRYRLSDLLEAWT